MKEEVCKTCKFFQNFPSAGRCRRYPLFVTKQADGWCGEWKQAKAEDSSFIIHQDGSIKITKTVTEDDLVSCDAGLMDIICLSTNVPTSYIDGEWCPIIEEK